MTAKPYLPLSGSAQDGWTKENEATATCFCGAVQLAFPTEEPGLVDSFICNCFDCRKITASMFASNFIVMNDQLRHIRGQELLTRFAQNNTIQTGNTMANHFCSKCGTLMYRISSGFPDRSVMRIGTVDDFNLHETKLKPKIEQFVKDRVSWCGGGEKGSVRQIKGNFYTGES